MRTDSKKRNHSVVYNKRNLLATPSTTEMAIRDNCCARSLQARKARHIFQHFANEKKTEHKGVKRKFFLLKRNQRIFKMLKVIASINRLRDDCSRVSFLHFYFPPMLPLAVAPLFKTLKNPHCAPAKQSLLLLRCTRNRKRNSLPLNYTIEPWELCVTFSTKS